MHEAYPTQKHRYGHVVLSAAGSVWTGQKSNELSRFVPRLCGVCETWNTWNGSSPGIHRHLGRCGLPGGFGHVPNHSKPDLRPDPCLVHLGPSPIYDIWNAECSPHLGGLARLQSTVRAIWFCLCEEEDGATSPLGTLPPSVQRS